MADNGLINHCVSVRLWAYGEGYLRISLYANRDILGQTLNPITLTVNETKMVNTLANFRNQGIQVEFKTTGIDEYFTINNLIAYIKPSSASYPQN
jgi:hypothetical protein